MVYKMYVHQVGTPFVNDFGKLLLERLDGFRRFRIWNGFMAIGNDTGKETHPCVLLDVSMAGFHNTTSGHKCGEIVLADKKGLVRLDAATHEFAIEPAQVNLETAYIEQIIMRESEYSHRLTSCFGMERRRCAGLCRARPGCCDS